MAAPQMVDITACPECGKPLKCVERKEVRKQQPKWVFLFYECSKGHEWSAELKPMGLVK